MAGGRGMSKLVNFQLVQSATTWGVVAATGALWVVQPMNWIKKTFFEKEQSQGK